eukprot:SAG11_NODE_2440_length_3360_cov_3.964735_1_plen_228_part_00
MWTVTAGLSAIVVLACVKIVRSTGYCDGPCYDDGLAETAAACQMGYGSFYYSNPDTCDGASHSGQTPSENAAVDQRVYYTSTAFCLLSTCCTSGYAPCTGNAVYIRVSEPQSLPQWCCGDSAGRPATDATNGCFDSRCKLPAPTAGGRPASLYSCNLCACFYPMHARFNCNWNCPAGEVLGSDGETLRVYTHGYLAASAPCALRLAPCALHPASAAAATAAEALSPA